MQSFWKKVQLSTWLWMKLQVINPSRKYFEPIRASLLQSVEAFVKFQDVAMQILVWNINWINTCWKFHVHQNV